MKNIKQAILGTVLGQAIGDAMGGQTEFNSHVVIDLGPTWGYGFPAFSDDTQMALAIAKALVKSRLSLAVYDYFTDFGKELDAFMLEVTDAFVDFGNGEFGANNRSPGPACMNGIYQIRGGKSWYESGGPNAKGNGGVMRVSYVGAYFHQSPMAAFQIGALTSVPTHANLESLISSGSMAYLVASSIQGNSFHASMYGLLRLLEEFPKGFLWIPPNWKHTELSFSIGRLAAAYHAGKTMSVKDFHHYNGNDGKAIEALAAAIHANARFSNFGQIITELASWTGDSDSTAAIGGALAGARFGSGFIRKDWRLKVEASDRLHHLADLLYQGDKGTQQFHYKESELVAG